MRFSSDYFIFKATMHLFNFHQHHTNKSKKLIVFEDIQHLKILNKTH